MQVLGQVLALEPVPELVLELGWVLEPVLEPVLALELLGRRQQSGMSLPIL